MTWGIFASPLLPWKKSNYYIFWAWLCSCLSYLACKARVPVNCKLWPVCLAGPYFPTLSRQQHDFSLVVGGGVGIEHKLCVLIFLKLLSEKFLVIRRIEPVIVLNVPRRSSARSPFLTLLSRRSHSGRWFSFGKRVWFIESHIVLIISFFTCFIYLIYCW